MKKHSENTTAPFVNPHTDSPTFNYLKQLLEALDGIQQSPKYHPEEDALFHSLQVYQHAKNSTLDPELIAAALFHDVGKSMTGEDHEVAGANALSDILTPRITWLIGHHLDLMTSPKKTRQRLSGTQQLQDLERLRRWDLAGRDPHAEVCNIEEALHYLSKFSGWLNN